MLSKSVFTGWGRMAAIFDRFKATVGDLSEEEQRAQFHGNAKRIYWIDEP